MSKGSAVAALVVVVVVATTTTTVVLAACRALQPLYLPPAPVYVIDSTSMAKSVCRNANRPSVRAIAMLERRCFVHLSPRAAVLQRDAWWWCRQAHAHAHPHAPLALLVLLVVALYRVVSWCSSRWRVWVQMA